MAQNIVSPTGCITIGCKNEPRPYFSYMQDENKTQVALTLNMCDYCFENYIFPSILAIKRIKDEEN